VDFLCPSCKKFFRLPFALWDAETDHEVTCPHCKARFRLSVLVVGLENK